MKSSYKQKYSEILSSGLSFSLLNWCFFLWRPSEDQLKYGSKELWTKLRDFPGGAVVENPPANAGDMGSNPGPGRSHMPRSN